MRNTTVSLLVPSNKNLEDIYLHKRHRFDLIYFITLLACSNATNSIPCTLLQYAQNLPGLLLNTFPHIMEEHDALNDYNEEILGRHKHPFASSCRSAERSNKKSQYRRHESHQRKPLYFYSPFYIVETIILTEALIVVNCTLHSSSHFRISIRTTQGMIKIQQFLRTESASKNLIDCVEIPP